MASSSLPITTNVPFSGSSTYSGSFQTVLNRQLSIASMPITLMQNSLSDLQNVQSAFFGLQNDFASLQTAVQSLSTAAKGSPAATVSDPSIVSASAASTATAGTYSLEVDNLGSFSTWLSKAGSTPVTDPSTGNISAATSFTLTINGHDTTINPADTSLQSLADAINQASAGIQATVVNVGSNSSPDYRLAMTSNHLAGDTITLNDGTDLTGASAVGAAAQYKVNGTAVLGDSRQITVAPGVTATLLKTAVGQPATITVNPSYSSLPSALYSLANAYNTAVDDLSSQHGQSAGALQGNSAVFSLREALSTINQYSTGSGGVSSLATLGLELDATGHLTFITDVYNTASSSDVQQFLGSTDGGGFLKTANDTLTSVADPTSGMIEDSINSVKDQITNQSNKIFDAQSRIADLQTSLQAQLTAADAAIAVLEQQKSFFTDLFAAQYLTNNLTGKTTA